MKARRSKKERIKLGRTSITEKTARSVLEEEPSTAFFLSFSFFFTFFF